jgi:adenylate cyclase class IV
MSIHEFGASGVVEARRLMAALGIQEDQLVSRAYIDLLQSR